MARSAAAPAAPAVHRWHGPAPREGAAARGPCAPVWGAGAAQGWCLPPRARWPRTAAAAASPLLLGRLRPRQRQPPALRRVPAQRPARPARERQPLERLAAAAGAAAARRCPACWAAAADRWLPGLRPWPAAAAAGLPWPLQLPMRQEGNGACIQCWLVERCLLNGVSGERACNAACRLGGRLLFPPTTPARASEAGHARFQVTDKPSVLVNKRTCVAQHLRREAGHVCGVLQPRQQQVGQQRAVLLRLHAKQCVHPEREKDLLSKPHSMCAAHDTESVTTFGWHATVG